MAASGDIAAQESRSTRVILVVGWGLVAALSYTGMSAALRWSAAGFNPLVVAFWKSIFCLPLLFVWIVTGWSNRARLTPVQRQPLSIGSRVGLVVASLLQCTSFVLLTYSLTVLPIATVTFLAATRAIIVLTLLNVLEHRFGDVRRWIAAFLGLTGVALIIGPTDGFADWRVFPVLIGAMLTSIAAVAIGSASRKTTSLNVMQFLACGEMIFIGILPLYMSVGIDKWRLVVLAAAAAGHLVCLFATIQMHRSVGSGSTALLEYLRLPSAALFGVIALNEALSWGEIAGASAIFLGLLIGVRTDNPAR
jgi:drug/metabolite transporter (DMT)-like permease